MANHLKMAKVQAIQALRQQGWSLRRIARTLRISRVTVTRHVALAGRAAASGDGESRPNPPTGSGGQARGPTGDGADGQNRPNPPTGSAVQTVPNPPTGSSGPVSRCQPYRAVILAKLEAGLSIQRIWQDLRDEHGFGHGYDSVKRFVRRLTGTRPLPFRRWETEPGAEAQVDFGTGSPVVEAEGRRRKTHVFRIVLSHSRKAYSEAVYRQTTDAFIGALENAFWHFGGVPQTLVIDNLKAAVTKADWYDPEINPKLQSFCEHYGTVVLPTKPYTPRHKGKVERGVDYVQANALKGRTFASLADQNRHLLTWETQVADTRIHGTTRKQVKKAFEQEKPTLQPLPSERFPCFTEAKRKVNRDGHVEVAKAYYSVAPEYLGRSVWVRWDSRLVRVFNNRFEQVAIHTRHEPGRFSTQAKHIDARKRSGVERGATYLLTKTRRIGPQTGHWAEQMLAQRGIEGVRVLMGLLNLATRHESDTIEQACQTAAGHGAYRLRTIRELIKRQGTTQQQFEFIEEHPIIRSLSDYQQVVHTAFTKEPSS